MSKINRNDPCPCGSGLKYKKCCLQRSSFKKAVQDAGWLKLRKLESDIMDKHLMPYVVDELSEVPISIAAFEFFPDELSDEIDEERIFESFFMPWVLFNWIPYSNFDIENFDEEQTIAQNYARIYTDKLTQDEMRFIKAMDDAYFSFYIVREVELEKQLIVKDLLLGTTHTIKEYQGTYYLKPGDIMFARILTLDNQSIFVGIAPSVIPSDYCTDFVDFKNYLIKENEGQALDAEMLRDMCSPYLLDYYFETIDDAYNRHPDKELSVSNSSDDKFTQKMLETPEVVAQIKEMAKKHWENWFDEPIPVLEGKTPRQAAKTKKLREKLEALLLEYESRSLSAGDGLDLFNPDMAYLREKLALDDEIK